MAKRKNVAWIVGVGLIAFVGLAAGKLYAQQNRYGPATCGSCKLDHPVADVSTKAFIKTYVEKLRAPGLIGPNFNVFVGDTIVICNASHCVDYTKTDSHDWEGVAPRIRGVSPRPGGGGAGRPATGRPAYSGPTGSSGGGRSGSVTVGAPAPQKSRPNQDN